MEKTELAPIEYTNAEVWVAGNPEVLRELINLVVPARVGLDIQRLAEDLNKEYVKIQKALDDLVRKYGEKDDKGNATLPADHPNRPEYDKERAEMMDAVITRANWGHVVLPADTKAVSARLLMLLGRFVSVKE